MAQDQAQVVAGGAPLRADHRGRPWEPGAPPDERKASASAFRERAMAWFAQRGVTVASLMTDNGNAYRSTTSAKPAPVRA